MQCCTILLAVLSCLSVHETTILWRVNVEPPAYLFGTVHLPQPIIWPSLSNAVKAAFENSTHFLPEFDVTNFFSSIRMRMCLNSHVPPMPMALPPPPPLPPPPGFANQHEPPAPLLDVFLTMEARRRAKTVESLESVDIYCEFTKFQMESLSNSNPSVSAMQSFPNEKTNGQAKHIYNCDLNHREELLAPSIVHIEDQALLGFKQRLEEIVERRDTQMTQKIDHLLKERSPQKRYFFAIGYIHLMSPTGIIDKLRRDFNYSITRLCSDPPELRAAMGCQGPSWCDPIAGL